MPRYYDHFGQTQAHGGTVVTCAPPAVKALASQLCQVKQTVKGYGAVGLPGLPAPFTGMDPCYVAALPDCAGDPTTSGGGGGGGEEGGGEGGEADVKKSGFGVGGILLLVGAVVAGGIAWKLTRKKGRR